VGESKKALAALGMAVDAQGEAAIKTWLDENSRDQRAAHEYSAADYGLSELELENDFARYIRRFITA
jgi:hypothetical protein